MSTPDLNAYARLVLNTGLALAPGQKLMVIAEPPHRDFVTVLLEEAYLLGVAYVHVELRDTAWQRARLQHSAEESLEFTPGWLEPYFRELVDNDWAYLYLSGSENPAAYDGLDPARISRWNLANQTKRTYFREAMSSSRVRWCVAALPTDGWARQVLGADATASDLWKSVAPILLLDTPDPTAAWKAKIATLTARCQRLRDLRLKSLHFTGTGTDLRVGLLDRSLWRGGDEVAANGSRFSPNLPTEEVFTTPDWRLTEGHLSCTRPVEILGVEVRGVTMSFAKGRVTAFDATVGREVLEQFLASDAQANALGEVALVDGSSKIFQSGQVFHSILLDENAACHVALGSGYTDALEGGRELKRDELLPLGCNESIVHIDFMIGSPDMTVSGVTGDGREVVLIRNGVFAV